MSETKAGKAVEKEEKTPVQEQSFSKEQLLASERYANRVDLVRALLKDNEVYTFKQVDDLMSKYLKGKVN